VDWLGSGDSGQSAQPPSLWPSFFCCDPVIVPVFKGARCSGSPAEPRGCEGRGENVLAWVGRAYRLEAQIVSKMALLFGTTWMVNAVVVSGLLCLIVGANLVYSALPRIPLAVAYAGLFVSLAVVFAVPMEQLFYESWTLRAVVATLALCTPAFFAGIIFTSSFARVGFRGSALGSNLFGSLLGGLLESSSLWFGLKSLTILAARLYLASAVFLRSPAGTALKERDARVPSLAASRPGLL